MKNIIGFVSMFVFLLLTMGCHTTKNNTTLPESDGKLTICVGSYPVYDFTRKIGGDRIQLIPLFSSSEDAHEWEPSPSDIVKLENADIFIYSGAGFEYWADAVLNSLKNPNILTVEASAGLATIHSDPHVWLSIPNAKAEMANIKDALAQADPLNKEFYEANYNLHAEAFDRLDEEFRNATADFSKKDIVVSHEAFGYLCDAYGLNQTAIEGLSQDSEPSPTRMAQIIDFVVENDVRVIFFEELASPKIADAIAKAANVETAVLNPLENLSEEQQEAGDDYLSIMKQNLEALRRALQ